MRLVSYKYRQKETISRTERASAETIYDSAMRSPLQAGRQAGSAVGGVPVHFSSSRGFGPAGPAEPD